MAITLKDEFERVRGSEVWKTIFRSGSGSSNLHRSQAVPASTESSLTATHSSPDGRLTGWEVLLAMFVHTAHHRGQAEIYLRNNGIRPPSYMI